MHKLIALYHPPKSEDEFRSHLVKVHLPLVEKFPGLRALRYGFGVKSASGDTPYFAIVECDFDDESSLHAALDSPEGALAAADVPNYAQAGVTIITLPVVEFNGTEGRTS